MPRSSASSAILPAKDNKDSKELELGFHQRPYKVVKSGFFERKTLQGLFFLKKNSRFIISCPLLNAVQQVYPSPKLLEMGNCKAPTNAKGGYASQPVFWLHLLNPKKEEESGGKNIHQISLNC